MTNIVKRQAAATLLTGGQAVDVVIRASELPLLAGGESARVIRRNAELSLMAGAQPNAIPYVLRWDYTASAAVGGCFVTVHALTNLACVVIWRLSNDDRSFLIRSDLQYDDQTTPHTAINDTLSTAYAEQEYTVEIRIEINDEIVLDWAAKDDREVETLTIPAIGSGSHEEVYT